MTTLEKETFDDGQFLVDQLNDIQTSGEVLKYLYEQTKLIEQLKQNLESVILLGKKDVELPSYMLAIMQNLDAHIEQNSCEKLQQQFTQLTKLLNRDRQSITSIVNQLKKLDDLDSFNFDQYHNLIKEYSRRAKTALVIRLSLKKKNIEVISKKDKSLDSNDLESKIHYLRVKENQLRHRILYETKHIRDKISVIQENVECPSDVKEYMDKMDGELKETIDTIEQHIPIETLDFNRKMIDTFFLKSAIGKITAGISKPKQKSKKKSGKPHKKSMFFWKKICLWLNTPWKQRWKTLDK